MEYDLESIDPKSFDLPPDYNPRITISEGATCIVSSEISRLRASVCSPDPDQAFKEVVSRYWIAWKEATLLPEEILSSNGIGHWGLIGTYSSAALKKLVSESNFYLIGSKNSDLGEKESATFRLGRNSFARTNSFGSFSIFKLPNANFILVFPPRDINGSEIFLAIQVNATYSNTVEDALFGIEKRNQNAVDHCAPGLPEITEIFGEPESELGRWIEVRNRSENFLCEKDLFLEVFGQRYELPPTIGFFLPNETRVYSEENSKLEGVNLKIRWGDLKREGKIRMIYQNLTSELDLPGSEFKFQEKYVSWKHGFSDCSYLPLTGYLPPSFCMDPGMELRKTGEIVSNLDFCHSKDFILEELNATGLYQVQTLRADRKFLDLEYTGFASCIPSNLSVVWGTEEIPIQISKKTLVPGDILSLGALPFLFGSDTFSYGNLEGGKYSEKIFLKQNLHSEITELWSGSTSTNAGIPIGVSTDHTFGHTVSITWKDRIPIFHPEIPSVLPENYSPKHRVSPGQKFKELPTKNEMFGRPKFSEVSWMGSYKGTESVLNDRFIELKLEEGAEESLESIYLEVYQDSKLLKSWYFPLEKGFTVLSSNSLSCFLQIPSWKIPGFILPSTGKVTLLLKDPISGKVLDQFSYDSSGPGRNDTSTKVRKSAALSLAAPGISVWRESEYWNLSFNRSEECANTHASPNDSNHFSTYLHKQDGMIYWVSSAFSNSVEFSRIRGYFPWSETGGVSSDWLELPFGSYHPRELFSILEIPFEGSSLLYLDSGSESVQIRRSSLKIKALQPNPIISSNEWVLICNEGVIPESIDSLYLFDTSSEDKIVPFRTRFPSQVPSITGASPENGWELSSSWLAGQECGYVLSPGFVNATLPWTDSRHRNIFSIASTSSIGNGLASDEPVDLFRKTESSKILLHSYGNRYSTSPFSISVSKGEIPVLKSEKDGDNASDYEILMEPK
ncbi:hypothetical protein CH373_15180 [Leptospira perolatii]|uniref:Uncharacterized protein n=1 Tax=Leptospira perolatii TaxID=2023191 RepID=A0A2M9ZJN5_9LEPT|nr:hypothetical protein CH360_10520 [Leptospira perolatii]PJZ72265.1 hypothetical protein CH373_15180 [Leptospira perolatii]